MFFRILLQGILMGVVSAQSPLCASEDCKIRAALIINLLKFIAEKGENLHFCLSSENPLRELLTLGYEKNKNSLSRISIRIVDQFTQICDIILLDENKSVPAFSFVISNQAEIEDFNIRIFLLGKKYRFIVNLNRETRVKIDPRLLKLAHEVIK